MSLFATNLFGNKRPKSEVPQSEEKPDYKKKLQLVERANEQLFADLTESRRQQTTLISHFNALKGKVDALIPQLSPDDHAHIESAQSRGPPPQGWILDRCSGHIDNLKSYIESLEDQIHSLSAGKAADLANFQKQVHSLQIIHQNEKSKLMQDHKTEIEDERLKEEKDREEVQTRTNEAHQLLRNDIDRLEKALLVKVDDFQPMSDYTLKTKFFALQKAIESVARWSVEVGEEEVGKVFVQNDFLRHARSKHWRFLIEGALWEILMEAFFLTPFGVFGTNGQEFFATWCGLFETEHDPHPSVSAWPHPSTASERWRSITFEALRSTLRDNTGQPTSGHTVTSSYESKFESVKDTMARTLWQFCPQSKATEISAIVDQARSLAVDFGGQRCRLQLFWYETQHVVQKTQETYYDVNTGHDEMQRGVVQLKVAPGVKRVGDGRGYSFRESGIVHKCKVYLQPIDG